jgi:hypothetical protein
VVEGWQAQGVRTVFCEGEGTKQRWTAQILVSWFDFQESHPPSSLAFIESSLPQTPKPKERTCSHLMTSDSQHKASREGSD